MELARSYVGILLPPAIWPKIQETQMNIRRKSMSSDIKWDGQNEALLTLCALGEQPWEMIKRAASILPQIIAKHPGMNLSLEGLVGIPNQTQPRHVYLNVKGDTDALCAMQAELARYLAMLMAPTEKVYQPMVHIGRLKVESEAARTALGRGLRMVPPENLGSWRVEYVDLIRTQGTATGVSLEPVERYRLGS